MPRMLKLSSPKLKASCLVKAADKVLDTSSTAVSTSKAQLLDNIAITMTELNLRTKVFSFHHLPECNK
tara:strand:+ start:559 stop:762 length:204 start_codon:yes stop_codon:yes gene_type:complete